MSAFLIRSTHKKILPFIKVASIECFNYLREVYSLSVKNNKKR